jgi:hypothetical protein
MGEIKVLVRKEDKETAEEVIKSGSDDDFQEDPEQ